MTEAKKAQAYNHAARARETENQKEDEDDDDDDDEKKKKTKTLARCQVKSRLNFKHVNKSTLKNVS